MKRLTAAVDNASLVLFRVAFGVLAAAESFGAILTGWVAETFVEPAFTFRITGFEWLAPLPGHGMIAVYVAMGLCGLMIATGYRFRAASVSFTVLWSYTYLTQTSHYNNHYYLIGLVAFLLTLTPAHTRFSFDARSGRVAPSTTCPRWAVLAFVAQMAIVYTYAGIAKLDADWLAGKPLTLWYRAREDGWAGPLLRQAWLVPLTAWGGLAFDLGITPLLLWRRTRLAACVLAIVFHLFNSIVFGIGVFPYLALAFLIFFAPDRWLGRLPAERATPGTAPRGRAVVWVLGVFFAVQVLLPLRHWLFPGPVGWTEEGHRMAWRMMLRHKQGSAQFVVRDPATGDERVVLPAEYLSRAQARRVAVRPDMILQFSRWLSVNANPSSALPGSPAEVYVRSTVSLNGRPGVPLVDCHVDMARARWGHFEHSTWLNEPDRVVPECMTLPIRPARRRRP